MNEKFWDLKKTKQDNMINGALKVFARSGFRHASTDEIVAEASISKGLLFHYFYSKNGLYEFLTEYCARFALVELGSEVRKLESIPFFDLQNKLTKAQSRVMRQYPYLFLFLEGASLDDSPDRRQEVLSNIALYSERLDALVKNSLLPERLSENDAVKVNRLLHLARIDTASVLLDRGSFSPEKYIAEMAGYTGMFERMYMN